MLSVKKIQGGVYLGNSSYTERTEVSFGKFGSRSYKGVRKIINHDGGDSFIKNKVIEKHEIERTPEEVKKMMLNSLRIERINLKKEFNQNLLYLNGGHLDDYGDVGEKAKESLYNKLTRLSKNHDKKEMARVITWNKKKKESEYVVGIYEQLAELQAKKQAGAKGKKLEEDIYDLTLQKDRLVSRNENISASINKISQKITELEDQLSGVYYIIRA